MRTQTERAPAPVAAGRLLAIVGAGCAATSGLAVLLHSAGVLQMPAAVSFISVPGGLALAILGIVARRRNEEVFLHRLAVGAGAGLLATIAYDVSRWVLQAPGWIPFDAFRAMPAFGQLIIGLPADHIAARTAGWVYHFWNGITFGIIYALVAGPAPWAWAVAWSVVLEALMVLSYPRVFGVLLGNWGFWVLSLTGHVCYGAVLGLLMRRYGVLALPGGAAAGLSWYRRYVKDGDGVSG